MTRRETVMGGTDQKQLQTQLQLLEQLQVFKIHGRDKRGRLILHILANYFPARMVGVDAVNKYLSDNIYPRLQLEMEPEGSLFSILYVHTHVDRSYNYPGMSALRCIYDHIPPSLHTHLDSVYFLHPTLQSRLFLATFGRFFFSRGLYGKVKYLRRVDYLWEHVKRNEIKLPEFVYEHDEDLEYRNMMVDYGLESDHPRIYSAPSLSLQSHSPVAIYSLRCLS